MEGIGKYRIVAEIGQGATSHVYKAYDPALERHVAIKVIAPEASGDPNRRRRFEREAQAAALLNHRHIVTVYELGREADRLYIVMELLEGIDLRKALVERRLPGLDEKLDVVQQVAAGLDFAHLHGIVHRDVKPANIHLLRDGLAKIMDFGLARLRGSDITRTGLVMGTPHYMSPEQVRGEHVDARSDVFSLGSILYEMLTGQKPFDADSVHSVLYKVMRAQPTPAATLRPDLPSVLLQVLERAMAPATAERFPDAAEFHRSLAEARQAIAEGRGNEILPSLATGPSLAGPLSPPAESVPVDPAGRGALAAAPTFPAKPIRYGRISLFLLVLILGTVAIARWGSLRPAEMPRPRASAPSQVDELKRSLVEAQVELARKKLAAGNPVEAAWQARRALKLDPDSSPARQVLESAMQTNDRFIETFLAEARADVAKGDTAGAIEAYWKLLDASPDTPAARDLIPVLDEAFESKAKQAHGAMEESRQEAENANAGQSDSYTEGIALARQGETAFRGRAFAAAAREYLRARDRFRLAMP